MASDDDNQKIPTMPAVSAERLRQLNAWAAFFHGAQAVACVILLFTVNDGEGYWDLSYRTQDTQLWRVQYRLAWLMPTFSLISCVAHTTQLIRGDAYVHDINVVHHNPIRWIEYAPSAGCMVFAISNLSGIEDPLLLGLLVFGNFVLQYSGYLVEEALVAGDREGARRSNVLGWTTHMALWVVIWIAFFATLNHSRGDEDGGPPDLVYAISPTLFVMFTIFGIPLERWRLGKVSDYGAQVEVPYIVLSLAAKSTLMWFVFGGVMRPRDERD